MTLKPLAVTALLAACTHRVPILQASLDITERTPVKVESANLGEVDAYAVPTSNGALVSFQLENGAVIEPANVVRVHETRRLRGAGEGFLIGLGVGTVTGIVIGLSDGDSDPCSEEAFLCFSLTAGEKAVVAGALVGGLGGIVGLAIGAIRGSRFIYENQRAGVAITPTGPAGSVAGLTITY